MRKAAQAFGPARIKSNMGQNLRHSLGGNALLFGVCDVILQGAVQNPLAHQSGDGHDGAVPQGKLRLPVSHLAKENIVVETDRKSVV